MDAQIQGQETEYKPWGLTAGSMVGRRQADDDAANLLAIQGSQLGNVVKQKDAMVAQGQMDDPEWLKAKLSGEIGQGQSLAATGKYDTATVEGKIASSIAKYAAEVPEQQFKQEQAEASNRLNAMTTAYASLEANQWNPAAIQSVAQKLGPSLKIPPEMLSKLVGMPPQELKTTMEHLMNADRQIVTYTPSVLQKNAETTHSENAKIPGHLAGISLQNAGHADVARIQGQNQRDVEQMRIDAGKYNKAEKLSIALQMVKTGKYEAASIYYSELARAEPDSEQRQQYQSESAKYEMMAKEKAAAGAVKPGAIDVPVVSGLPGQQQSPARQGQGASPVSSGSGGHWEDRGGKRVWVKG